MFRSFFLISLIAVGGCKTNETSKPYAVVGREDFKEEVALATGQGLLEITKQKKCNASLVAKDIIATALHCVDSEKSDPTAFSEFSFVDSKGKKSLIKKVLIVDPTKDYASYMLVDKYESYIKISNLDEKQPISIRAFDHQNNRFVSATCNIKAKLQGQAAFEYDCDTLPGFSGAAVIQNSHLVGIHIGFDPRSKLNYALDLEKLADNDSDISSIEGKLEWGPHVRVKSPHIRIPRNLLNLTGCSGSVAASVGGGLVCGGCIAGTAGTAGAVAILCAKACGTTAGALTATLGTCQ